MVTVMRAALLALVWGVFATGALAQRLTVPKYLAVGQTVTIRYSDPGRAGETITVDVDNGGYPVPIELEVQITLDENGDGSASFLVPAWTGAHFNAPGVAEETRFIEPPDFPIFAAESGSVAPVP